MRTILKMLDKNTEEHEVLLGIESYISKSRYFKLHYITIFIIIFVVVINIIVVVTVIIIIIIIIIDKLLLYCDNGTYKLFDSWVLSESLICL